MTATTAFWMSVTSTFGLLAFGVWRLSRSPHPGGFAIGALAIGAALLVLAVSTYAVYAVPMLGPAREIGGNLILAFVVYAGVHVFGEREYQLPLSSIVLSVAIGFLPLVFLGFYVGLQVACAFGDCL